MEETLQVVTAEDSGYDVMCCNTVSSTTENGETDN